METQYYNTQPQKFIKSQIKSNLKEFRKSSCYSDVTLLIGRERLACHRIILACASDFFKAMFSSQMMDSRQRDVNLSDCGLSPVGLKRTLDYIYNLGGLDDQIPFEEYGEIFNAADYLQVVPLKLAMIKGIAANICVENVLAIHRLAVIHDYPSLAEQAWTTIQANTEAILTHEDFPGLSEEEMVALLADDKLTVPREVYLVRAVASWLAGGELDREDFAVRELFPLLRLNHVNRAELDNIARNKLFSAKLLGILTQAWNICIHSPGASCVRKGTVSCIYSVGGLAPIDLHGKITLTADSQLLAYRSSWARSEPQHSCSSALAATADVNIAVVSLSPMTTARVYHGTVVSGSWLYVVGGEQEDGMMQASTDAYNLLEGVWTTDQIPHLDAPRSHLGLVAVEGVLWVMGGYSEQAGGMCGPSDDVMICYPGEDRTWFSVEGAQMPVPLARMSVVEHKGLIFVFGGVDCFEMAVSSVFCFNPVTSEWTKREAMPRTLHSMASASYEDVIYIAGGDTDTSLSSEVLAYTVSLNSWKKVGDLCNAYDRPLPRKECSALVLNQHLVILGGVGERLNDYSCQLPVHFLDLGTNSLLNIESSATEEGTDLCNPAPRAAAGYFLAPEFFDT